MRARLRVHLRWRRSIALYLLINLGVIGHSGASAALGQVSTIAGGGIQPDGPATTRSVGIQVGLAEDSSGAIWIGAGRSLVKVSQQGDLTTVLLDRFDIRAVVFDSAGDVYFAESALNKVSKLEVATGEVSVVAGTGSSLRNFYEGIPATSANLRYPSGLAIDAIGNLYISDTLGDAIRKMGPDGRLFTYAGGEPQLADGVPATESRVEAPMGLLWKDEILFIAEHGTGRVRAVSADGIITTVAGSGSNNDRGDFSGDGGLATDARLHSPRSLSFDQAGNMFIADAGNHRVRKVDSSGIISTFAGSGTIGYSGDGGLATDASFDYLMGVLAGSNGKVYISDFENKRTRVVDGGIVETFAGNGTSNYFGDGGPATSAGLSYPTKSVLGPDGLLYFSDSANNTVRRISSDGTITTIAGNGQKGNSGDGGLAIHARLYFPQGIGFGLDGALFVAEAYGGRIRKIDPAGTISTLALLNDWIDDLVVAGDGDIYVSLPSTDRVLRIDPTTGTRSDAVGGALTSLTERDGLPGSMWRLWYPRGLFIDANGDLLIADSWNQRILSMDVEGNVRVLAGRRSPPFLGLTGEEEIPSKFGQPIDVFKDLSGNLHLLNLDSSRIFRLMADESPEAVAGNGARFDAGDGGPALEASFSPITNVTVSSQGGFYVSTSQRIRFIEP